VSDIRGATQRAGSAIAEAADTVASEAGGQANELLSEIEGLIRQNPLISVAIAAAVGYAVARIRH
jgi:ElaB/YqjD/DUF883 family membrane-anchored ribosome-binding protein